jgi:hypothetical protein
MIEVQASAGESYLNDKGDYGWELVAVLPIDVSFELYQYIWKRLKIIN